MADSVEAKVLVVNRALRKLGLPASYTIDMEDDLGGTVDLVWPGVEATVVSIYNWSVCQDDLACNPLADAPVNGWTYGFELPATRVGEPLAILDNVVREHYLRDFMLSGGKLYTNVTPVWARCRVLLDPAAWDIGFSEAFSIALAAALAVPLLQDEDRENKLFTDAFGGKQENMGGGLFGKLITINRAAQPQGRGFMRDDPLTNARFG
jgi:hypothetical protein